MKLLLHICCGPCAIYPVKSLREQGIEVTGCFYNNNIHPLTEWAKRRDTLSAYAESANFPVIYQKTYDMEGFLQKVVFREKTRCPVCYHDRLLSAAHIAKKGNFEAFSSTLLYSKFQNHDLIRTIGEAIGKSLGVDFFYQDFREGWKEGIAVSKDLNMYRQQYCGCIYSESERYSKLKP
jgi:predicted adenine nucleotide alpha hydrolase (AANH) superfamily ATPase